MGLELETDLDDVERGDDEAVVKLHLLVIGLRDSEGCGYRVLTEQSCLRWPRP